MTRCGTRRATDESPAPKCRGVGCASGIHKLHSSTLFCTLAPQTLQHTLARARTCIRRRTSRADWLFPSPCASQVPLEAAPLTTHLLIFSPCLLPHVRLRKWAPLLEITLSTTAPQQTPLTPAPRRPTPTALPIRPPRSAQNALARSATLPSSSRSTRRWSSFGAVDSLHLTLSSLACWRTRHDEPLVTITVFLGPNFA